MPEGTFFEARAEALPCDDGAYDLVFLGQLLHEVEDPLLVLKEARRVGRLRVAVLEWPYREDQQGPPLGHRMRPEQVADLALAAGFQGSLRVDLGHMTLFLLGI